MVEDILINDTTDNIIAIIMTKSAEVTPMIKEFAEVVNGKTLEQIKEDPKALDIISSLYAKLSTMSSNMWCLDNLSHGKARFPVNKEEYDAYVEEIFSK